MALWACPKCHRKFTRKNQRHACGTGGEDVLRHRSPELVALYASLEKLVKSLGTVELVKRDRYVLMRTKKIFTDLVVMSDALRLAIHLPKEAKSPLFIKVVSDRRHVTHVAKIKTIAELAKLEPFLRAAFEFSIGSP